MRASQFGAGRAETACSGLSEGLTQVLKAPLLSTRGSTPVHKRRPRELADTAAQFAISAEFRTTGFWRFLRIVRAALDPQFCGRADFRSPRPPKPPQSRTSGLPRSLQPRGCSTRRCSAARRLTGPPPHFSGALPSTRPLMGRLAGLATQRGPSPLVAAHPSPPQAWAISASTAPREGDAQRHPALRPAQARGGFERRVGGRESRPTRGQAGCKSGRAHGLGTAARAELPLPQDRDRRRRRLLRAWRGGVAGRGGARGSRKCPPRAGRRLECREGGPGPARRATSTASTPPAATWPTGPLTGGGLPPAERPPLAEAP